MKNNIILKVLSLGVGLSVGIVLIAKIFFELSYDSFYADIDRIYRINTGFEQNGDSNDFGQVSGAVAVGFMNEVPGVEYGTRTTFIFASNTYIDEEQHKLSGTLVCADTCFFKVFNRPILAGSASKALGNSMCAMVSRSFAEKILPSGNDNISDVIGKQIYNEDYAQLRITIEGVFEDFPENGSLDYDILLSMDSYRKESTDNWVGNDRYKGYVKLYPNADPNGLSDAIRKMQEAHQPLAEFEKNGVHLWYFLTPFDTMHTTQKEVKMQIILLSIVAALLLIISLLNYILIVISSLVKRSREVGVRKCYGAESWHIYGMLSREALIHIIFALVLAGLIIFISRGMVEDLLGVPFSTLIVPQSIWAIAGVIAVVLIVSIVVPAELYQRIPIYAALKNYTEHSRRWKLGLLGIQILINVFLVIMMIIIGRQYETVSHSNTGYNYENLYYISMYDGDRQAQTRVVNKLRTLPEVVSVATCYNLPFQGSSGDNIYLPNDDHELFNIADQYEVSDGFFETMEIPFIEGRAPQDSSEIVVDERFVAKINEFIDWSDGVVGKQILITGHSNATSSANGMGLSPYTISGVYKRYLIGNLQNVDERPSALFYGKIGSETSWMPHTLFRVSSHDLHKVRAALAEVLEGKDIDIVSFADSVRSAYTNSEKMRNTIAVGAAFSLLIALLGLVGFIRDEAQRRSKEIAVRKINGATTRNFISDFASDIMKLALLMAVLACAGAYFTANIWLEQFAEKVALNPLYFISGTLIVLTIVLAVIIINCLKIARQNPVISLKSE
ncbi:MAG: FtsX-like permease family protein [Bacteroidales bacterium]|nr:FtsX-like permease family protein [Bacteroidales bacterium]